MEAGWKRRQLLPQHDSPDDMDIGHQTSCTRTLRHRGASRDTAGGCPAEEAVSQAMVGRSPKENVFELTINRGIDGGLFPDGSSRRPGQAVAPPCLASPPWLRPDERDRAA